MFIDEARVETRDGPFVIKSGKVTYTFHTKEILNKFLSRPPKDGDIELYKAASMLASSSLTGTIISNLEVK